MLDVDRYRYQKFMSDIAGQDIEAHSGEVATLIRRIRDWLRAAAPDHHLPGGAAITRRFERFRAELPDLCRAASLDEAELIFSDFAHVVSEWLRQNELIRSNRSG